MSEFTALTSRNLAAFQLQPARTLPERGSQGTVVADPPRSSTTRKRPEDRDATGQTGIPQYSRRAILGIWAAAALPMAGLSWAVAPWFGAGHDVSMVRALLLSLTVGLVWQFVLVMALVWREQRSLRWSTLRSALWLQSPRSPRTGRVGGKLWLIVIPLIFALAAKEFIPHLPIPGDRDWAAFLESPAGQGFFHGAWGWYAVFVAMGVFNTVLGEELLFRGFLLPRMNGAFGRGDWLVNGVLFGAYHLHVPWSIPVNLLDTFIVAYPTKRFQSAWIGIAVHSVQTVVLSLILLALVI